MSKWRRIKEKILNIFTVEIEEGVEISSSKELETEAIQVEKVEQAKIRKNYGEKKVAYQYPKNNQNFKFPVIPDSNKRLDRSNQIAESNEKRRIKKENVHLREMNNEDQPAFLRRQPRVNHIREKNERLNRTDSYKKYQSEKVLKEIEGTPAYLRRQKQSYEESATDNIESYKQEKLQLNKEEPLIYSKPDELDEVFRKKYGYYKNINTQNNIEKNRLIEEQLITGKNIENKNLEESLDENVKDEENLNVEIEEINLNKTFENEHIFPQVNQEEYVVEKSIQRPSNIAEHKAIPRHLLDDPKETNADDAIWLSEQQNLLEETLQHFKIKAEVVHLTQGPTVTRFEIKPALGVKVSTIRNLADDLKLNLAAKEIRIEAPIPGKNTVGIEIPNKVPEMVTFQQVIESDVFQEATSPLTIALGLTIDGSPLVTNINKMPHGLIAGATGSGKSVCINSILLSLLYKASYEEVKFLLIDPKMVELAPYNGIPHLVAPVITDVKAATAALQWAVNEMEERYDKFVEAQVRNIEKYNEKVTEGKLKAEKIPYLVIVIDELADLMMKSPQDVEDSIARIAQKARACGIHLLVATQRPSVDVITGLIKANIPTRIAFSVSSQADSRTIIDTAGAERLLGRGDMLFIENGSSQSLRLQGPFVSDEEIERVTSYIRTLAKPQYLFEEEQLLLKVSEEDQDDLFEEVLLFVLEQNQASTSLLQRQFRIGYNRAARLIDSLYEQGIISGQNGSKPREILITYEQAEDILFNK